MLRGLIAPVLVSYFQARPFREVGSDARAKIKRIVAPLNVSNCNRFTVILVRVAARYCKEVFLKNPLLKPKIDGRPLDVLPRNARGADGRAVRAQPPLRPIERQVNGADAEHAV